MKYKVIALNIEEILFHKNWSLLPTMMPGCTIIQVTPFVSKQDIEAGNYVDCTEFVFRLLGTSQNTHPKEEIMRVIFSKYRQQNPTDNLERGDIVMYGNSWFKTIEHVGIFLGNGYVLSKFGDGYVIKHPLKQVLPKYGKPYAFLKKLPETRLNLPEGV